MEGYIDLSKEIHPLVEALIFNQIEAKLNIATASVYPLVNKSEELYYVSKESFEKFKKAQTPWLYKKREQMTLADKIAMFNKLNGKE